MDDYSEFSTSLNQEIEMIPEDQNIDDIQDLGNYPRDSFVDHTPNSYINQNINYSSAPFQKIQLNSNNINYSQNGYIYDGGYSSYSNNSSNLYQHTPNYGNPSFNLNNQNKEKNNFSNRMPIPEDEPIPQDTIIDEEEEKEEQEQKQEQEQEILEDNLNIEQIEDTPIEENINKNNNINNKKYDIQKLLEKCRKKGIPPDNDFKLDGWKIFYPPDEKFFLWEKGRTIKNQILAKNENNEENFEIYEGEVNKDCEKHGFGILITPKYVRKGTWRDGEFTGWCRESRANGDIFEGKFIDGAIFGKGINKNHKGNVYAGDFVDNKREGKGELKTQKIQYDGDFKYDKFNGKGKLLFIKEGHSYEGDFKNNEITGVGTFKWSNGDVYEGDMTNGKMNGYGKYTYSNGQIYEGNYVNGVKEGLGKLIYPNGKVYEGEFKKGKPYGEGTLITDGKRVNIIYQNGKFQRK